MNVQLIIDLLVRQTGLQTGLQGAMGTINRMFVAPLKSQFAGIFSVGIAASFTRSILRQADAIDDMAARAGMSVEGLQELQFAADRTGTSIEAFATAIRQLAVAQIEAIGGSKTRMDAFERLGVSLDDLKSKNPEQLLRQIGRSMTGSAVSSQGISDAIETMGRSADQILPAMRAGLDEFAESARQSGVVIEESLVKKLAESNDQWEIFNQKLKTILAPLVGYLATGLDVIVTEIKTLPLIVKEAWAKIKGDTEGATAALEEYNRIWREMFTRAGVPELAKPDTTGKQQTQSSQPAGVQSTSTAQQPAEASAAAAAAAQAAEAPRESSVTGTQIAADTLTRIGLFRGGQPEQIHRLERMIEQQRAMIVELREVNRNLTTEI